MLLIWPHGCILYHLHPLYPLYPLSFVSPVIPNSYCLIPLLLCCSEMTDNILPFSKLAMLTGCLPSCHAGKPAPSISVHIQVHTVTSIRSITRVFTSIFNILYGALCPQCPPVSISYGLSREVDEKLDTLVYKHFSILFHLNL